MSKNIKAKVYIEVSIPEDQRFDNKNGKQKEFFIEKIVRSVCRFGNLEIKNVNVVLK